MDLGLEGFHVLVTGASGGIGLETAKLFADQGAKVTAHYNSTLSTLLPLSFKYGPDNFRVAQADLSKEQDVIKLFDHVADAGSSFGPVRILVVNHGIAVSEDVSLLDMSLEQWDNTLSVNLTAAFLVVREFLRRLSDPSVSEEEKQNVNVVFVGSTAGKFGEAGNLDYAVTKSALMHGFLLSLKNEIVHISPTARANCVAPGWARTAMAEHALNDGKIIKRALATTPLNKIATPREVANQILVFASPILSSHISGQVLMVDGGMEGRMLNE